MNTSERWLPIMHRKRQLRRSYLKKEKISTVENLNATTLFCKFAPRIWTKSSFFSSSHKLILFCRLFPLESVIESTLYTAKCCDHMMSLGAKKLWILTSSHQTRFPSWNFRLPCGERLHDKLLTAKFKLENTASHAVHNIVKTWCPWRVCAPDSQCFLERRKE